MTERPAISLDLEDAYLAAEPLTLRARLINTQGAAGSIQARIQPAQGGPVAQKDFVEQNGEWVLQLDALPAGLYRVEVRTNKVGPQSPPPVHDVFQVAG
jgi:hypothetical protein